MRVAAKYVAAKYVMPALGLAHKLDVGAKRLVDGVTDPTLLSGAFYASAANKLNGPMVNQAGNSPELANPSFQDNANEAIHRFLRTAPVDVEIVPLSSAPDRCARTSTDRRGVRA